MRFPVDMTARYARVWLTVLLGCAGLALAIVAPAAQAAEALGVESVFAGNCNTASKGECNKAPPPSTPAEELAKAEKEGYTQAAGHPPYGVTEFKIATAGTFPNEAPLAFVTHVRTDVGTGVSANPEAVEKCSLRRLR